MTLGAAVRRVPGARRLGRVLSPARRRQAAQWRRIAAVVDCTVVQSGPFAGMTLTPATTGSEIPKRLGSYEQELHPLVESWLGYDRVLDVGCGEGWYVVGLAKAMPEADVWGFDTSPAARTACARMAAANGVEVHVEGLATPAILQRLVQGRTLIIVDAEGGELDVLEPAAAPALHRADVLVELHDFLRPGTTQVLVDRFADREQIFIGQQPRDPGRYPLLAGLPPADQRRAVDESRPPEQRWLWMPAPPQ
jgi:SAM-dependent methyltransferase